MFCDLHSAYIMAPLLTRGDEPQGAVPKAPAPGNAIILNDPKLMAIVVSF
jgi:hypothetical protein